MGGREGGLRWWCRASMLCEEGGWGTRVRPKCVFNFCVFRFLGAFFANQASVAGAFLYAVLLQLLSTLFYTDVKAAPKSTPGTRYPTPHRRRRASPYSPSSQPLVAKMASTGYSRALPEVCSRFPLHVAH